jgi:hypothetical protein
MFVYIDIGTPAYPVIDGLLLRLLPEAVGELTFVRMGVFNDHHRKLYDALNVSRGAISGGTITEDIDLDDPCYADLVYTVTVI